MTGRNDPLGKRSLFSAPLGADEVSAGETPVPTAGAETPGGPDEGGGRRALFSAPQVAGPAVIVACRTCRARTPVSLVDLTRRLIPSVWVPLRPWSRWMRCPSCATFSWCRVEWGRLGVGRR